MRRRVIFGVFKLRRQRIAQCPRVHAVAPSVIVTPRRYQQPMQVACDNVAARLQSIVVARMDAVMIAVLDHRVIVDVQAPREVPR